MNPRSVAEDAAAWYLSVLDPTSSHADNVSRYLRGAVLVITRRVLLGDDDDGVASAAAAGAGDGGGVGTTHGVGVGNVPPDVPPDWRSYLARVSSYDSDGGPSPSPPAAPGRRGDRDSGGGGNGGESWGGGGGDGTGDRRLSRRSVARMRAFLSGCALAVPDDPFSPPPTPRKGSTAGIDGGAAAAAAAGPAGAGVGKGAPAVGRGGGDKKASASASASASPPLPSERSPLPIPEAASLLAPDGSLSLRSALSGFSVGDGGGGGSGDGGGGAAPAGGEGAAPPPPKAGSATATALRRSASSRSRSDSNVSSSSSSLRRKPPKRQQYPQFDKSDLTVRLELYVRSLRRVHESSNECVVSLEPPRAVRGRVRCLVRSFVRTVGCVGSVGPVLTGLVGAMTRELLAVEVLGEELRGAVGRLVSEYEHQTSFASLAFLSTPEESAESHLSPLLTSYIQYLQSDWENLVAKCELESMLSRAVDPDVRNMFKTIEFQSIGHLLDVCHESRDHLQNITLPRAEEGDIMTQCSDPKLLRQAMKDVRREIITVNGRILPPARNLKDLVRLLTEALNSKPLTLPHGDRARKKKSRGGKKGASPSGPLRPGSRQTARAGEGGATSSAESDAAADGAGMVTGDGEFSSGCEGDTDGSSSLSEREQDRDGKATRREGSAARAKRRSFDLNTVEFMTRRLLIAASRTGTGGDAYFVVRDLFGGDEVEVLPSKCQPAYSSHRQNIMGGVPRKGSGGTIELIVRLASVTIKCHGRYDVYPKHLVGDCEPLIQLHTTTTEIVSMQEVRVNDESNGTVTKASSADDGGMGATVLMLKEKKTDTTGHRTLSIRPALYEKVEVWATPS